MIEKRRLSRIVIILVLTIFSFTKPATAQSFSKLVVFGDSLSDTGNLASVTVNFPFPFFANRLSNGPILADFLADQIGSNAEASRHLSGSSSGFNYAIAGGNIVGADPEDLAAQVTAYLVREQTQADPLALYFVFMGGNDLRDIRSITSPVQANARISQVLDALVAQISRLAEAGATTFLVPNMPNIGRLPETLQREEGDAGVTIRARDYSLFYNQQLAVRIAKLRSELDIGITEFDLFSELEVLFGNSARFGFTQTQIGCFEIDGFNFQPDCVFGTRFDRFVFFDNIHPTARTNELVGLTLAEVAPKSVFSPLNLVITPILQLLLQ